jgi:hypothetical protein
MRAAERLFLPPREERKAKDKGTGSRMSRRLLKLQKEKESAREMASKSGIMGMSVVGSLQTTNQYLLQSFTENCRRKKLLRASQKSIMIWDPDGPARKPPKEVADLLLSTDKMFKLSETFQRVTNPDFVFMTLGGTSRGCIERAYDWLIPIISKVPETIGRLPSSASCFLLLKAYGTDGEEWAQLKELSTPLLNHVAGCVQGSFGKDDCVKAFDLLMTDMASHIPDRRRCARRVLRDSMTCLGHHCKESWMSLFLEIDHADALVSDSIRYMVRSLCAAHLSRRRFIYSKLFFIIDEGSDVRTWSRAAFAYYGTRATRRLCEKEKYYNRNDVS